MRASLRLVAFLLLLVALAMIPQTSAATAEVEGCSKLVHTTSVSAKSYSIRVSLDTFGTTSDCAATSTTLVEGECRSYNLRYNHEGSSAPTAPTSIRLYWYAGTTESDHGASGADNWAQYLRLVTLTTADFPGTQTFCATTDGTASGTAKAGDFRLVIRSTNSGAAAYDLNQDSNAACNCFGNTGTGNTATGTLGVDNALYNPNLHDPLYVHVPDIIVGETATVRIHSEYDYGDYRTGAASDILLYVRAPDGTWIVNAVNPTETEYPGGLLLGNYHYAFTASQAGAYEVIARLSSDDRSSKPFHFLARAQDVDRAHIDYLLAHLNDTMARESTVGTLATSSQVTTRTDAIDVKLNALEERWIGEFRAARDRLNLTAEQQTLLDVQAYLASLTNASSGDTRNLLLDVQAYVASRLNATTGELLTTSTWADWRGTEWTSARGRLNDTARESTVVKIGNDSVSGIGALGDVVREEGATTRMGTLGGLARGAWQHAQPPIPQALLFLAIAGLLVLGAVTTRNPKTRVRRRRGRRISVIVAPDERLKVRRRRQSMVIVAAGLVLAYLYVAGFGAWLAAVVT